MEDQLKLLLGLIFNSIVLGVEIDAGLPAAYAATFAILMAIQLSVRRRIADIYLENQRQNNRVIAHGYTAWDNVFSGNRYNWRLWLGGFKSKLRDCFRAQVKAIMAREGLSALGGIIGLAIVFSAIEGRDQEPRLLLAYHRSPRLSLRHTGQPRRAAGLR